MRIYQDILELESLWGGDGNRDDSWKEKVKFYRDKSGHNLL